MTVKEAMTGIGVTPSADYTGVEMANDFIFAICTDKSKQAKETDWIVCANHVKEHSGALNASTTEDEFIRTGLVVTKANSQRTLAINGNRCVGDPFQDFILSHKIKYGTGDSVVVPYLYFSSLTGKGEKGTCTLIVTSDVGGAAGGAATFSVDVKGIGKPEEYTYSAEG